MRATAPMARHQVPLNELVVGFMESRVGVSPLHPRCREPAYLMAAVLRYRKPRSPYRELDSHLQDVSSDKTAAVLSCVHSLEEAAYRRAKAEYDRKLPVEAELLSSDRLMEFGGWVSHKQTTSEETGVETCLDLPALFASFAKEKGIHKRASVDTALPEPKKPKENRGNHTVEGRKAFHKMTMSDRLEFLDRVYSDDHGDYANADRQFLLRASKAVLCYRQCCGKSFETFMGKYGKPCKRKTTSRPPLIFQLQDIKGCETCGTFVSYL